MPVKRETRGKKRKTPDYETEYFKHQVKNLIKSSLKFDGVNFDYLILKIHCLKYLKGLRHHSPNLMNLSRFSNPPKSGFN